MTSIFTLLYGIIVVILILISIFIVFHLLRYTLNKTVMLASILFFIAVTSILLLTNIILFSALPLNAIFPTPSF